MGKSKNKGSAGEQAAAGADETKANGALVFEVMDDEFVIPAKVNGGEWDNHVQRVIEAAPKVVKVFETSADDVNTTYTRAKQLRQANERAKAGLTIAVRLLQAKDAKGNLIKDESGSIVMRSALLAQAPTKSK
jgi:hypothetical protein